MNSTVNVHQVFADYFKEPVIKALAYQCSEKLSEGHICIDFNEFQANFDQPVSKSDLLKSRWVTEDINQTEVFILHHNKVYFHRYFIYESKIIDAIKAFIKYEDINKKQDILLKNKAFIEQLFPNTSKEPDWQMIASLMSFIHNFSIITGGPGTGKTTTIAKLLSIVFHNSPNTKVALVAPTGKAAARIKESLHLAKSSIASIDDAIKEKFDTIHSSTIHRLLGHKRRTHYFKHHQQNPVNFDIVIVDESSMMGISLMSKLMESISPQCQLILLGDKNQLASVEAGSVFGDICQSQSAQINTFDKDKIKFLETFTSTKHIKACYHKNGLSHHIIELKKSYRFDKTKGIGKLSQAILNNQFNNDSDKWFKLNDPQVSFFSSFNNKDFDAFYSHFEHYLNITKPLEALKAFSNARILTPTHQGNYSVDYFNQEVEKYLQKRDLIKKTGSFYHNQPIIITKNDYQLQLFNGDVGLIRKGPNGELQAYFESDNGELRVINTNFIQSFDTVFAMTIHKSQGSEFEKVALVLPNNRDLSILSKELLYTGLTRAKTQLDIFSTSSVFSSACQKPVARASGIADRINSSIH